MRDLQKHGFAELAELAELAIKIVWAAECKRRDPEGARSKFLQLRGLQSLAEWRHVSIPAYYFNIVAHTPPSRRN